MDISVEKECVKRLVSGELRQFLNLYDANFSDLYKYFKRRVNDNQEVERLLKFTYLEALALYKETPTEYSYFVWLLTLAKKRVDSFLEANPLYKYDYSEVVNKKDNQSSSLILERVVKMFSKMRIEESEIIKLKFFEQLSDSDIMIIYNLDPDKVGAKIYRVLKRAHFLLFGEGDENQGVYFGELSGLLSSFLDFEKMNIPEAMRLGFKSQLSAKIDNFDLVLDSELLKEMKKTEEVRKNRENLIKNNMNKGSNDPAKVFVDAANSFNEEQKNQVYKEYQEKKANEEFFEEMEKEEFWDFIDSIKSALIFVPVFLFVVVVSALFFLWYFPSIGTCKFDVLYSENLSEVEIKDLRKKIANPVCKFYKDVEAMEFSAISNNKINVFVERKEYSIKYVFDTRGTDDKWFVKSFQKETIASK